LIIARDLGVLSSTVQLLSTNDIDEVSIPCLSILGNFLQDDQSREALISLGIITNLVHLVESQNSRVRKVALKTLKLLIERSVSVRPILSSGVIDVLISIVTFSRDNDEILTCLEILSLLSSEETLARHICYRGGITGLSRRLNTNPPLLSEVLTVFLKLSKDEICRSVIVQEGTFPKLIALLRQTTPEDQGSLTWILSNFGLSEADRDVVVKYQVIRCCLALLRSEYHNVVLGSLRGLLAFSRFPFYVKSILQEDPQLETLRSLSDYNDTQIQTVSRALAQNLLSRK